MVRFFKNIIAVLFVWMAAVFVYPYSDQTCHARSVTVTDQHREPIRIAGVQEPEEMLVEPFPLPVLTEPERMLRDTMKGPDGMKESILKPALNQILEKYPDFSDGYIWRLDALCAGVDRAAILSDVNNALKYAADSGDKDTSAGLLSTRAKIEYANGNEKLAMEDLEKAILASNGAFRFTISDAVAPEKTASSCIWTESDMNMLVQHFPADYRSHLFRGLYYGSSVSFSANDDLLKLAVKDLNNSSELNRNSSLPHFFKAEVSNRASYFKQGGLTDAQRDGKNNELLGMINKALIIDPNFLPAISERAFLYFKLKQYKQAMSDYDKVLVLDPKNSGAYHDRGLLKMQIGNAYDAISDFDKAIEIKERKGRKLMESLSYEARAEAYMKTHQWKRAIKDLTTAISLQTGGAVLLWDIKEFRAIYPEYKLASDDAIASKLNKTFYPNMTYEGFSGKFLHRKKDEPHGTPSFTIQELYLKRSDAYLKLGDWHKAAIEYHRALNGFPSTSSMAERWREFVSEQRTHLYVDMKTLDETRDKSVKFWIKETSGSDDDGNPYDVTQYEMNCDARKLRTLSLVTYDASGNAIRSQGGGRWEGLVPDSRGELFFSSACRQGSIAQSSVQ